MGDRLKLYLKNFDWLLLAAVVLLLFFGLIEIYSIALGQGGANFLNFKKQLVFGGLGILSLFGLSLIDYQFFKSFNRYFYIAGIILLAAVLFLGSTINGTRGWFNIFGLGIQPVEFVKIILIIFLARMFANASFRTRPLKYFLLSGLGAGALIGLVIMQPDFGSAMILAFIWVFMMLVAGFNKKYFIIIFLAAAIIFTSAWFLLFKDYQKQRIITFLNPTQSTLSQGYNRTQAIIAVGSGGLIGRGVGFGSQSQLKFLPSAHTDFIFSVVSEELGFLGVCLMLSFFAILYFRSLMSIRKLNDDFAIFFVLGAVGLIFIEMFINIGMNIGIMPVVGIALPFVSYGGSSVLAGFILIGMIENIIIKSKI